MTHYLGSFKGKPPHPCMLKQFEEELLRITIGGEGRARSTLSMPGRPWQIPFLVMASW